MAMPVPKGAQGKISLGRGFSRLSYLSATSLSPQRTPAQILNGRGSLEPPERTKGPGAALWSLPIEGHWLCELFEWNRVLGSRTHSRDEVQKPGLAVVWGSLYVLVL